MRVRLRFFAAPREAVGVAELPLDVPDGATVGEVLADLVARYPPLGRWREHLLISVNREFTDPDARLADGDEVAFMPPVSGGGDARLHEGDFFVDEALARIVRDGAGAAVAFLGIVRATSGERPGAPVDRLEFEAYREMAEAELSRVRDAARAKFGLVDAAILHRTGTLRVGEDIVLVVVTAAHRDATFEAARWIMDELKTVVPIWKKEIAPDGAGRWVHDV